MIGGIMLTLGGTFGSLLIGALRAKWAVRKMLVVFSVLAAVKMVAFIQSASLLALAFVLGVVVGMLINGCVARLYTITPASYAPPPQQARSRNPARCSCFRMRPHGKESHVDHELVPESWTR